MKDMVKIALIFVFLLTAIPALALFPTREQAGGAADVIGAGAAETEKISVRTEIQTEIPTETETAAAKAEDTADAVTEDTLKVLDFTDGQVLTLSMRDYVIGAILAEMPPTYNAEALKAQAVAARTYAYRQREKQRLSPDPELMGADISNDSSRYQAYFTPEQAKRFYGSGYETYLEKAADAADSTDRLILVYDGEPIVAAFHSMSGGRTESAETVWGSHVDYLVPVDSEGDEDSPTFLEEKIFTSEEICGLVKKAVPNAEFSDDPENWFSVIEKSASGTVTKMTVGGEEISGTEFRSILSLRSANFTVTYESGKDDFSIVTKGYGHGVGLSQYGANVMAENGSDFKEILAHYYTGAETEKY